MDLELPDEARAFADSAQRAVVARGGTDVARRAEADPGVRMTEVKQLLDELGAPDIRPTEDVGLALVAAELCRVAGRYVLPFPVVGYLMAAGDGVPRVMASSPPLRCDHADLFPRWRVCELSGAWKMARHAGLPRGGRLAPFVGDLVADGDPADADADADGNAAPMLSALWASYLGGVVEHALELAVDHVRQRAQFGRPLAALQDVQFRVADATVAVDGLRELARFTVWRTATGTSGVAADALGAYVHAVDTTQVVLRLTQQLHGAAGMCDEYDISILVRHVQPALRLLGSADGLAERLFGVMRAEGFASLFPQAHGTGRELLVDGGGMR